VISGLSVVVEVFWKSAVVLGVALCLTAILRNHSADLRRLVLSTAIVAMLAAAVIFPVVPRWRAVTPSRGSSSTPPAREARVVNKPELQAVEVRPAPAEPPSHADRPTPTRKQMPGPIPLIWFAGSAFLVARFAVSLRGLRRLRKMSDTVTDVGLLAHVKSAPHRVALLQNSSVVAPVTWGIVRPVILLPTGFEELPEECRNAILRHELAHIQANDFFVRVLSEVARSLIWFQPLVWIARRRLREEQEMACDDRVLAEGGKPSTYAKLLLDWSARSPRADVSIAVGISQGSCLKRRLYALLDPEHKRNVVSRGRAMAIWFAGFATALPLAALSLVPWTPPVMLGSPVKPPGAAVQAVEMAQVQAVPPTGVVSKPNPRGDATGQRIVVLVLDKSASMEGLKLELLRAAATAVIEDLRPEDQVGILTFNQDFQWAVPIRRADDKAAMKQLISGIYADGGTKIPEALREACEKILPYDAPLRHIVLLTDGISEEGDTSRIAKDAADHRITISTIGLGPDVRRPYLENIAADAGGKSYFLNDPNGLEQIMLNDVKEFIGTGFSGAARVLVAQQIAVQPAPARPLEFEVASVKPHEFPRNVFGFSGNGRSAIHISGNRVTLSVVTLAALVKDAYDVKDFQVTGAPGWTDKRGTQQFYDIEARSPGDGTPTLDQVRQMLQALLADRFQLKLHREPKDFPVYDLVVGKNGPNFKETTADSVPVSNSFTQSGTLWRFRFVNKSMADLVLTLAINVDRPIIDKTGLTGSYDFTLEFERNIRDQAGVDGPAADGSVFSAVQDQLGLKLTPAKEPMEVLVIDHAKRPSEN